MRIFQGVSPNLVLKVAESEKERQLRRMQQVNTTPPHPKNFVGKKKKNMIFSPNVLNFQVAGNIGLINPLIFNHFGYGTYAQVTNNLNFIFFSSKCWHHTLVTWFNLFFFTLLFLFCFRRPHISSFFVGRC